MADTGGWAPDACTLPTADRPFRGAEFDALFSRVVRSMRSQPARLDLVLPRAIEAVARDLARRESECCSFFTFDFDSAGDHVVMHIGVSPPQVGVLDAIEERVRRVAR